MPQGLQNKKVAITGASGFIGNALCNFLSNNEYSVVKINRSHLSGDVNVLASLISDCSIIINLAGAPITDTKWTSTYKRVILKSRVDSTQNLVDAIHLMDIKPKLFISTSAVGVYDSFEVHDEFSTNYSDSFLGSVCQKWENVAYRAQAIDQVRLCIVRLGVVLGNEGGAFPRMIKPFKYGMGAKLGDGHQVMPFIHINDVLSAFWYLIQREASHGIYNLVAPQMLSNLEITKAIQKRTRRSFLPGVPEALLKMFYGDGAEILLVGQKVVPKRLQKDGFPFAFPTIESILDDLLI